MTQNFKIEGIYDQRTLKLLKAKGLRNFGFDFSPKSFNFIQEHVFLNELIPLLDPLDRIHLHFIRSNDPMIVKVIADLQKVGIQKENIYIDTDEWDKEALNLIYELIRSYEGTVISISHNRKYNEILDADVSLDMGTGVVENLKLTKNL